MELWIMGLTIAMVAIFVTYGYFKNKYPVLYLPFDNQFWEFYRVYRTYKSVRTGKKTYHVFAREYCNYSEHLKNQSQHDKYTKPWVVDRLLLLINERKDVIDKYFTPPFSYGKYLSMLEEYNLTEKEMQEEQRRAKTNTVPLLRKALIFESLFRAAGVDADTTQKARFIRNLLEIELETDKIANTNIYKQLKKAKNAPETEKERLSRADDLEYAVNELEYIDLQKEKNKLINES